MFDLMGVSWKAFDTKVLLSPESDLEAELQETYTPLLKNLLHAVWTTAPAPLRSLWEMKSLRPHFKTRVSEPAS